MASLSDSSAASSAAISFSSSLSFPVVITKFTVASLRALDPNKSLGTVDWAKGVDGADMLIQGRLNREVVDEASFKL